MSPAIVESAWGALRLSFLFVVALLLPVLIQLTLLYFAGWALFGLLDRYATRLLLWLALIGVPIHEFSHALAALVTLNRVVAIKPILGDPGGAFVSVPGKPNLAGRILASPAPLFGGTLALWLTALYIIPDFRVAPAPLPKLDLESAASLGTVLTTGADYLGKFVQAAYRGLPDLPWQNWRTYLGLYIALSVATGVAPSNDDLRIFFRALPLAFVLILPLFAWLNASGDAAARFLALQQTLGPHLLRFSTALTYAFALTMLGVVLFLPLGLWRRAQGSSPRGPARKKKKAPRS